MFQIRFRSVCVSGKIARVLEIVDFFVPINQQHICRSGFPLNIPCVTPKATFSIGSVTLFETRSDILYCVDNLHPTAGPRLGHMTIPTSRNWIQRKLIEVSGAQQYLFIVKIPLNFRCKFWSCVIEWFVFNPRANFEVAVSWKMPTNTVGSSEFFCTEFEKKPTPAPLRIMHSIQEFFN